MPSGWRQVAESGHPGCLWLVLETEREEILFKARNWEIKDLLCSVSLACEAPGYSLPALCTPGFKPNGMNNSCHAACVPEPMSRMSCGTAGDAVLRKGEEQFNVCTSSPRTTELSSVSVFQRSLFSLFGMLVCVSLSSSLIQVLQQEFRIMMAF